MLCAIMTFTLGACVTMVIPVPVNDGEARSHPSAESPPRSKVSERVWFVHEHNPPPGSHRYHLRTSFGGEFREFHSLDVSYGPISNEFDQMGIAAANIGDSAVGLTYIESGGPNLSFQSEPVNGTSYVFSGILRDVTKCGVNIDKPSIEGHLFKLKDGRVTASTFAVFQKVWGC